MQSNSVPSGLNSVTFDGVIWGLVPSASKQSVVLDIREEESQTTRLHALALHSLKTEQLKGQISWWERIVYAIEDQVITVKYLDPKDPTQSVVEQVDCHSGERVRLAALPAIEPNVEQPQLYDYGTEYHQTIATFLSLDLPLSCEYLEWQDKIIISYYLRSENGFTRYLLLLAAGEKVWKLQQDGEMKGFAPGAFFVCDGQLIFVRERNEVCIYTL